MGDGGVMLHWDGSNWNNTPLLTSFNLEALAFIDANDGWAIGSVWVPGPALDYDNIFLHWNGSAWADATPQISVENPVLDIDFVNADFGIAVGPNNIEFRWFGGKWNERGELPSMHYSAIDLMSANDGWAVGSVFQDNNIHRWNGNSWISTSCPTEKHLNDVQLLSPYEGWAVGEDGTILRYSP